MTVTVEMTQDDGTKYSLIRNFTNKVNNAISYNYTTDFSLAELYTMQTDDLTVLKFRYI